MTRIKIFEAGKGWAGYVSSDLYKTTGRTAGQMTTFTFSKAERFGRDKAESEAFRLNKKYRGTKFSFHTSRGAA